jgi:hypothetical protein
MIDERRGGVTTDCTDYTDLKTGGKVRWVDFCTRALNLREC